MSRALRLLSSMLLALLVCAAPAAANDYLSRSPADWFQYVNLDDPHDGVLAQIEAVEADGWTLWSELAGLGLVWLGTEPDDNSLWYWDGESEYAQQLADLDAPLGTSWPVDLPHNQGRVRLASRLDSLRTPAGAFSSVVRLAFPASDEDAGVVSIWFAPHIGVIKWSQRTPGGLQTYALSLASRDGRDLPAADELELPGWMHHAPADPGWEGFVVAAPHDGFEFYTGAIVRDVVDRLGWGWVEASGFRSEPLRYWHNVNRPSSRAWEGGFGEERETALGRAVFQEYRRRLGAAGGNGGALQLLVEVHGHARSVDPPGAASFELEVIELSTTGFSQAQLERLRATYATLQRELPRSLRLPLVIDRLDPRYEYRGWLVPFQLRATGAKQSGSLQRQVTRHALHFELPGRARATARARQATAWLLTRLLEHAADAIR